LKCMNDYCSFFAMNDVSAKKKKRKTMLTKHLTNIVLVRKVNISIDQAWVVY
jgi:hypothetical protein